MNSPLSPLGRLDDATLIKTDALIDGEWVASATRFAVDDPATGERLADVANLGAAEADAAIAAAARAWPAWRSLTAKARGAILMKWFALITQHAEDLRSQQRLDVDVAHLAVDERHADDIGRERDDQRDLRGEHHGSGSTGSGGRPADVRSQFASSSKRCAPTHSRISRAARGGSPPARISPEAIATTALAPL